MDRCVHEMLKDQCALCLGQTLGDEETYDHREKEAYGFNRLIETARATTGNRSGKDDRVGNIP